MTKEFWWVGPDSKPFKDLRWARHLSGQCNDLTAWLRAQEMALERLYSMSRRSAERDETESWTETVDAEELSDNG